MLPDLCPALNYDGFCGKTGRGHSILLNCQRRILSPYYFYVTGNTSKHDL